MPRANRHYLPGHIWHITHRCHQRKFLLEFAGDRVVRIAVTEAKDDAPIAGHHIRTRRSSSTALPLNVNAQSHPPCLTPLLGYCAASLKPRLWSRSSCGRTVAINRATFCIDQDAKCRRLSRSFRKAARRAIRQHARWASINNDRSRSFETRGRAPLPFPGAEIVDHGQARPSWTEGRPEVQSSF